MEPSSIKKSLAFDDVLIRPAKSEVLPNEVKTSLQLTKNIRLEIPLLSSAMDTVTEHRLAIALAQSGGMGIIHKNMSIEHHAHEVKKVKKFETGMVIDPVTISSDKTLEDALNLMANNKISGIPVVDNSNTLEGILTNRDVRFATNMGQPISELMTSNNLVTVKEGISSEEAQNLLHKHRIEKLLVVDDSNKCIGLITVKDIEKSQLYPNSTKDNKGQLRVGAAVGVGDEAIKRSEALIDAGVDMLVIDTAHGHSMKVIETVKKLKKMSSIDIIAGNVATLEATKELIDNGADCVKVGIGPGSICTTRVVATTLVVHIEPGPIPTFTQSAPLSINSFVASRVATFPAIISIEDIFFSFLTVSITFIECPWAVSITSISTPASISASDLLIASSPTPTAAPTLN